MISFNLLDLSTAPKDKSNLVSSFLEFFNFLNLHSASHVPQRVKSNPSAS